MLMLFALSFSPFYFIHYSDPQIGRNVAALPNVAMAVNQIDAMVPSPHFVIVAGDMGNNPGSQALVLAQWMTCDSLFGLLPMPKYYVPGNNDIGYENEICWTPAMLQFYRNFWGADYYSFDADSCHYVALNSTLLDTYDPHACYPYSLEQDSFMRWDLQSIQQQDHKHLFLFFHFPLYVFSPLDPNLQAIVDRPRRDTVLQYLIDYDFTAVFTGHWHQDYTNFYWPSLLQTGIATCNTDPPVGYRIVKVFENGIETFTVYLPNPLDSVPLVKIIAAAVNPETVEVNLPVSFTCIVDSFNFPDWVNVSFNWQFGDGDSSTVANTSHVYSDTGHYRVVLAVYELHDKCAIYKFDVIVEEASQLYEEIVQDIHNDDLYFHASQNAVELRVAESGYVILDLYQADGRLLGRIVERYLERGLHRLELDPTIPSGVYFLRLSTPRRCLVRKYVFIQ
ncbi:MAG: metallophosphoesterase [candidate division WOR-3 bacterium]|nr:MAG: metallophosphoesterase [candidate division WOR-3 bacterium]